MRPLSALVTCLLASTLSALSPQASFVETFDAVGPPAGDGPAGLIAKGWIFKNQSQPKGPSGWFQGGTLMTPFEGAGYLEVDGNSTDFFGGDISTWAILPAVPGQVAGDALTFHVQRFFSHSEEHLQVRYSPSGGTGTGSGFAGTGDFSSLLLDLPLTSTGWQTVSLSLPGSGRVALRYVVENACLFGCAVPHVGFDLLSVGPPPPPDCNLPPLPQQGETVTWTAAGGPWEICADVSVPPGATVIVAPGASVSVETGKHVTVSGSLLALGTPAQPITFNGWGSIFGGALEIDGTAEFESCVLATQVHALHGGSIIVRDSSFQGFGISSKDLVGGSDHGTYLEVDGCTVSGASLGVTDGTLVVTDTDITGGGINVLRGYVLFDDLSVEGAPVSVWRERYTQPAWLDRISVAGSAGPALDLSGWDFHIGPASALQGNHLPVALNGGLLAGSKVPATGNDLNEVRANLLVGSSTWSPIAVPYVVGGADQVGGANLTIQAGTTVEFGPGASVLFYAGAGIQARGTPQAPIVFRRHVPGQPWDRINFLANTGNTHFEWCSFSGANIALQSDNSFLYADASAFTGNATGLWTNTFGLITGRKLLIQGNGVGAHEVSGLIDLKGFTNPSSISGNGAGIDSGDAEAQANWWGHPTGPKHPLNPGGQGDSAAFGVKFQPFRTTPPDFADSPPQVALQHARGPLKAGQKLILTWESGDDGEVVAHEVRFSPYGNFNYAPFITGLPGHARSVEITVPKVPPSSLIEPANFRVVAIDDAGQEGWDEFPVLIPTLDGLPPITFDFVSDLSGPFTFGDVVVAEWQQSGMSGTWDSYVLSDNDMNAVPYGGGTTLTDAWDIRMPYVSTDAARLSVNFYLGAGNRTVTFRSQPFTIRPDARLGDAPPTIALTSPAAGQTFPGGSVVPIAWTASDDESVRAIRLFVSTDAGETWTRLAELDGSATSYGWQLPASTGIPAVRLRAAAVDLRYQNSSATIPLAITAGQGTECAPSLGFAGPGGSVLSLCGDALAAGGQATLALQNGPPSAPAWIVLSPALQPTPLLGGTVAPFPPSAVVPLATNPAGGFSVPVHGGGGPATLYVQAVVFDPALPQDFSFSNALEVELLP